VARGALTRLLIGVTLAAGSSLPFIPNDGETYRRFHHWALFAGGLLVGAELGTARARER